jgi:membrane fusion protein (multidrug efflux system)
MLISLPAAGSFKPDDDMSLKLSTTLFPLLIPVFLSACDNSADATQATYPPPTVRTIALQTEDIQLQKEYPGRLLPVRLAEVRARVSGIILKRSFAEGSDVKAGDILFQIEPARFKAAVDSAKAQLARAEASLALAAQQETRSEKLLQRNVGSKEQYDVAIASRQQAQAEVAVAKANLDDAELDLSYASVRSPIDGRIGAALVTEGAFVRQEDGTQMAIIRDLSSVYVDFTAPLSELRPNKQGNAAETSAKSNAGSKIELVTNDGTVFNQTGALLFSSAVVNETTGQVSLRAEFNNTGHSLLPGTYVRVRMAQEGSQSALLIPQRAVQWDTLGQAQVMTVQNGKAVPQPVRIAQSVGTRWLISEGLKAGDEVIVDGAEKTMPGSPVTAKAITEDSKSVQSDETCVTACEQKAKF